MFKDGRIKTSPKNNGEYAMNYFCYQMPYAVNCIGILKECIPKCTQHSIFILFPIIIISSIIVITILKKYYNKKETAQ